MHSVTSQRALINTTNKYLLVGDSSLIIAVYDTAEEAAAGMLVEIPDPDDCAWLMVRILAPGETDSGTYTLPLPLTARQRADIAAGASVPGPWIV